MAVLREPVSATFSGVLGSLASIETTTGTGDFHSGMQGFIPRPRLSSLYGLGRIEASFRVPTRADASAQSPATSPRPNSISSGCRFRA